MNCLRCFALVGAVLCASVGHTATIVNPVEDVMTSAFFFSPNFVRGYAGDNRPVFRVSSDNAFGTGPETIYVSFDPADFSSYTSPVVSAVLTMESVVGGFNGDASSADPFNVSAHGVTANPIDSITDDTNPGGTIAWDDFFSSNILPAGSAATTVVDGFGTFTFDVTEVVNDWIAGSNSEFSIALTGKNDPQTGNGGNGFLHGFLNNTETPGSTFLTITPAPEPGSVILLVMASVAMTAWIARPAR